MDKAYLISYDMPYANRMRRYYGLVYASTWSDAQKKALKRIRDRVGVTCFDINDIHNETIF